MTVIINPGSRIAEPTIEAGWSNTFEGARVEADRWLAQMRDSGFGHDVEIAEADPTEYEGRWRFTFRHKVTGAAVVLETHGIDNIEAYIKRCIFPPRVYWNGSSSSNPQIGDFDAPGYVQTFRKA